ncbi:MAG: hypothetical protein ACREAA_04115 [Candidatus Polarisedimenticolia bacterium]
MIRTVLFVPLASGTRRLSLVLAAGVSVAAAADLAHGAETMNRLATNRLATNRLATNRLATNRLATNRLATNSLSSNRLEASADTAEILSTADGREVLSYIISCALAPDTTLEAIVPGAPDSAPPETLYTCANEVCVFQGDLGLADYWADRRLSPKGQRWVSACLFARVNAHDTGEAVSLRGLAPSLTVGVDEGELFTLQEGAFYGNIFAGTDGPIDWNACRGSGQASGENGGLVLRDCAEPDPADPTKTLCGFNYAGDCAPFTDADAYACRTFDAEEGTYGTCRAAEDDGVPGSRPYFEIITVYVSP